MENLDCAGDMPEIPGLFNATSAQGVPTVTSKMQIPVFHVQKDRQHLMKEVLAVHSVMKVWNIEFKILFLSAINMF